MAPLPRVPPAGVSAGADWWRLLQVRRAGFRLRRGGGVGHGLGGRGALDVARADPANLLVTVTRSSREDPEVLQRPLGGYRPPVAGGGFVVVDARVDDHALGSLAEDHASELERGLR